MRFRSLFHEASSKSVVFYFCPNIRSRRDTARFTVRNLIIFSGFIWPCTILLFSMFYDSIEMIEEVQMRASKRRTRGERTKRRERYLKSNNVIPPTEKKPENILQTSPACPVDNNNCDKCRNRPNKVIHLHLIIKEKMRAFLIIFSESKINEQH